MLSQLLIFYSYAFDEAMKRELRAESAPSLAMWANVLQYIGDSGVTLKDLRARSRIARPTLKPMLDCLARHGWIALAKDGRIILTPAARKAAPAFASAKAQADECCKELFGADAFDAVSEALTGACARLANAYPQYPMPAAHRGAYPSGE